MNDKAEFLNNLTKEQKERIEVVRSSFSNMYDVIDINCRNNQETKLALEKLQEAQFWAIKGISREIKK